MAFETSGGLFSYIRQTCPWQSSLIWEASMKHKDVVRQLDSIPSVQFITASLASAKAKKANAESRLAADVSKAWPEAMAAITHPIHVKASVRIDRPLHWRGGMLAELWKAKGSTSSILNFRDVTMVDQEAKTLGQHNRTNSIDVVRKIVLQTALGSGLDDGACDMGHLLISETMAAAMHANQSAYCIFGDLKTALAHCSEKLQCWMTMQEMRHGFATWSIVDTRKPRLWKS